MMILRDLPHTCDCTWCYIHIKLWKEKNGSTGFKNQGALKFIGTKIYSHHETYSSKVELMLHQHENVVQHESIDMTYLFI
jgi:hypothetical protein